MNIPKALKNPYVIGGGVLAVALVFLMAKGGGGNASTASIEQATAANISYSHDAAAYLMSQAQNASDLAKLQVQARTAETVTALQTADHLFSVKYQADAANYATWAGIVSTDKQVNAAVAIAHDQNVTQLASLPYLMQINFDTQKFQYKSVKQAAKAGVQANQAAAAGGGVLGLIGGLLTNKNFLNTASNVFGDIV